MATIIPHKNLKAKAYNSAAQSINNTTWTTLTFDSENFDSATMHSTSSNTSRITVPIAGTYHIMAHIVFDVNGTGRRIVQVLKNGNTYSGNSSEVMVNTNGGYTIFDYNTKLDLAANDYIELQVWHSKGSAMNVLGAASGDNQTTTFIVSWSDP